MNLPDFVTQTDDGTYACVNAKGRHVGNIHTNTAGGHYFGQRDRLYAKDGDTSEHIDGLLMMDIGAFMLRQPLHASDGTAVWHFQAVHRSGLSDRASLSIGEQSMRRAIARLRVGLCSSAKLRSSASRWSKINSRRIRHRLRYRYRNDPGRAGARDSSRIRTLKPTWK